MADEFEDGYRKNDPDPLKPLNIKEKSDRQTAVALKDGDDEGALPVITAAGRGKIAEQILQIAYENGIKVRSDADLAEMLAKIELDSPIPSEAFMAVAEILSYVYRANGEPNPFDAVLKDVMQEQAQNNNDPGGEQEQENEEFGDE
ncbi:MAG TPA: EscU/YscU/HrcU family type III secretion system export apparatus switch protein [Alphaproteobacteria bacterium]|nr:EscU/YscU/HrcU family type III secretion system export apparatus switch protein [Alphaproteobacteria bacterium]